MYRQDSVLEVTVLQNSLHQTNLTEIYCIGGFEHHSMRYSLDAVFNQEIVVVSIVICKKVHCRNFCDHELNVEHLDKLFVFPELKNSLFKMMVSGNSSNNYINVLVCILN